MRQSLVLLRCFGSGVLLAAFAVSAALPGAAFAQIADDAHLCADTDRETCADLTHRCLHRRMPASPAVCAANPSRRRLCAARTCLISTAATSRMPSPTSIKPSTLAPDFAPAYQNRGNAWYARGNFGQAIADYDSDHQARSEFALALRQPRRRAARPRLHRRRAAGLPESDRPRRQQRRRL